MLTYGSQAIPGAILLAGDDYVSTEQIAELMVVMQSARLSPGFAAPALERCARRPTGAAFEDTMTTAPGVEGVRCADETPTNVTGKGTGTHGAPPGKSPHTVAVRTSDARLAEYAPISSPSKAAIAGPDRLEGRPGYLI